MLDFRPDLDPRTPGLLVSVRELLPSTQGYYTPLGEGDYGPPYTYTLVAGETWPNVCFATRWQSAAGGIVIVGTNKRLNVLSYASGYLNVSHAAGDYALGGASFQYAEDAHGAFDLCAFGDVIIAANKAVTAQQRTALDLTAGTKFTDLGVATAAPVAECCCVAANFVFLGNVGNWSTVTGAQDILAWSAIGDHTDWRVNPQVTQSSYAQFVDTPGGITAVREFQNGIVVFKNNSMYRGRYVGAGPNSPIWDFERISDEIGCMGHRSVINIDQALIFVADHNIYIYDGTRPRPITRGIWEFIAAQHLFMNPDGRFVLQLGHNRNNASVWFSGYTMTLVWNYALDKWGMLSTQQTTQPIPCHTNCQHFQTLAVSSVTAGLPAFTTTPDHINLDTMRIFNGTTKNRNGTAPTPPRSQLVTGVYGQPDKLQTLSRVTPILVEQEFQYPTFPAPALRGELTMAGGYTPLTQTSMGGALMNQTTFRFDTLGSTPSSTITSSTSNYFSFQIEFRDNFMHIIDVQPKFTPAGER